MAGPVALRVSRTAQQSSILQDEVRFLGGVLTNLSLECGGFAREPAKLADQVRFLARTLKQRDDPLVIRKGRCPMPQHFDDEQPFFVKSNAD